jgi:ribonuclease-3
MDEKRRADIQELLSNPIFDIVDVNERALNIYDQSLTHSTYAKEMKDQGIKCNDNERFEFFGNFVFKKFKPDSENYMSERMKIVSNEKIAEIIRNKNIGIGYHIQLGKGQSLNDNIVADAFEALIGAIYLNHGMRKVKKIIIGMLSDEIEHFNPDKV